MNTQSREKLHSRTVCYGTWLASGSPVVAEIASLSGFDWLLMDMEHGFLTETELLTNLFAVKGGSAAVVVRVPTHDAGMIGRVLDKGADAIMVPHVESAEQAEALVSAMRYPPYGKRGYSRSVRACQYGQHSPTAAVRPLLFAQIENVEGVQSVEQIAAVDGVDVLFVGPADLRVSLEAEPNSGLSYEASLQRVQQAANAHSIQTGILVRDRNDLPALRQQGFSKIAIDSDLALLRAGFQSIRKLCMEE
jgi:2-keto-3-deoxy-L-rhamnonate aldolase RhmA